METLFGKGDGIAEPWYGYYQCDLRELSQETVNFIHDTVGLCGSWHDGQSCWVIDMKTWTAIQKFVHWCGEQKLDITHHVSEVNAGSDYYVKLVAAKLKEFESV